MYSGHPVLELLDESGEIAPTLLKPAKDLIDPSSLQIRCGKELSIPRPFQILPDTFDVDAIVEGGEELKQFVLGQWSHHLFIRDLKKKVEVVTHETVGYYSHPEEGLQSTQNLPSDLLGLVIEDKLPVHDPADHVIK